MAKKTTKKATTAPSGLKSNPRPIAPGAIPAKSAAAGKSKSRARPDGNGGIETVVLKHDQIAHRAYQLWLQTGNPDESQNWTEAERQLRLEQGRG